MNTEEALNFAQQAIETHNLRAVEIIAENFPRTIVDVLQTESDMANIILESSSLFFQIKDFFTPEEKQLLLKKIVPKLFRHAERIFQAIDRSKYPVKIPYTPGISWHLEDTIANFLLSGDFNFTYKHVVCTKRQRKQKCIVLLIDKSHSVISSLKLIILTSILFSLSMNAKDIALIGFDTQPEVIKGFIESQITTQDIITRLVNIRSGGKTNIFSALHAVKKEFSHQIGYKKTLVIISDLLATSGMDFLPVLKQMEDVRIILTPRRRTLQLTAPILGKLQKLHNIKLYLMTTDERSIPGLLEKVLYD
ncbi:MAG: VWA domain-containing protein [Candidatus Heimdallarchaeota archaeon]|nr:MAG: VWA domain-containing protein [Candidatus Heimdallarchaeota archaeon]